MNRIVLLISLLLLVSCSCEKQALRLAGRCPECFQKIVVSDTVATPSIRIDTVFVATRTVDTFVIEHNRASLEVIKQVDTFYTTLHLKPDTIIRTLHVPAPHIEPIPDDNGTKLHKVARLMRPALWLFFFIIVTIIYIRRKH